MHFNSTDILNDTILGVPKEELNEEINKKAEQILKDKEMDSYKALGTVEDLSEMKQKMDEIKKILLHYESTFTWGCNDSVHSAIAHAIYGVVTNKEYFLEEYKDFLNTL